MANALNRACCVKVVDGPARLSSRIAALSILVDILAVTTCPRHGRTLAERCTCQVDSKLTWNDAGLFCCRKCGSEDPRNLFSEVADATIARADAYLLGRLEAGERILVPELDALTFAGAVYVMSRVGTADIEGIHRRRQSPKTFDANARYVRVGLRFWPTADFVIFLIASMPNFGSPRPKRDRR